MILIGDNGTPRPGIEPPFVPEHGKGTMYEGSLNVALIVAGAGVGKQGAVCDALVSIVDLSPPSRPLQNPVRSRCRSG